MTIFMIKQVFKYYLIALVATLLDQSLKFWVYFNMGMGPMGQIKILGNFFKLYYTLNPGMAFGIQFGFMYDKIILTIIRIIATIMIIRYIWQLAQQTIRPQKLLWGWALILGGAAGNGIDSIFYGKWFNNAPHQAPLTWFYGQVIDMLYIDVWSGTLPQWVPLFGGNIVTCLPIFNIADLVILTGVLLILLAQKQAMNPLSATLTCKEEGALTVQQQEAMDVANKDVNTELIEKTTVEYAHIEHDSYDAEKENITTVKERMNSLLEENQHANDTEK